MNVLVVGLGSIARKHIIAMDHLEIKFKIYALRSKPCIEEKNIKNIYSLNELNIKLDFVIISNPTLYHKKTIIRLSSLKIPLFIEKPVLKDYKNVSDISSYLNKNKIISYVACNLRFHPSIIFLKKYIDKYKPRINEVNVYCGSYLPNWRKNQNYKDSYSSHSNLGGGVHLDLIHEIDYCQWIFGLPVKVNYLMRSVSSLDINSIDFSKYSLIYDNYTINITLNYYRKDSKREIELITDDDTISINLLNNSVYSIQKNKFLFKRQFNIQETYNHQMKYFIDNIKKNKKPMNNFDEGVNTLKIALNE